MATKLRTLWVVLGFLFLGMVVVFSLTPSTPAPPHLWDKAQHFIAYGWLMFWFSCAFPSHKKQLALKFIGLGIILECLQYLLPYRSFDLYDIAANSLGVGIGWLLAVTPLGKTLHWLSSLLPSK